MPRVNFQHLHYFWVVAREGTVTAAADRLNVTQPTISTQIAKLEASFGAELFYRRGNRLELTETGRLVQGYAAEIFSLGEAMEVAVRGDSHDVTHRFAVGIADTLPLLSAHRLMEPALALPPDEIRLHCRVDKRERLLAALAARSLDVVLSDSPAGPVSPVRVRDHLLAESDVLIFGTAELTASLVGKFPGSLHGAPFLLHTENTPLRRGLDTWFARNGLRPSVAGEVEDVALLQVLGRSGRGFFAAPGMVETEICHRYGVEVVGRADGVVERFYALTLDGAPTNHGVERVLQGGGGRNSVS